MSEIRKEQYKILLILCLGLALIGWRFHWVYLIVIAGVLLVCGLLSGYLLEKITVAWVWIGQKIGAVMSRVILSFVFIFILTPIAVIYRLFGKGSRKEKRDSYFIERRYTYEAADLEKIF